MRKFLTSGLILGLMVSPAIADDALYKDTNIGSSCTADFLGGDGTSAVNSFLAQYTPNNYTVAAGQYLAKNGTEGTQCPANSYCAGGTFTFSETDNQGMENCPSDYSLSVAGTSSADACYHNCTASDIENGAKVATIKGGTVTKGGTNTCQAECTTGYTFKAASGGTNPLSSIDISIDPDDSDSHRNAKTWSASFSYGNIQGITSCNDISGTGIWDGDITIKPGNTFDQNSEGQYCWCKITGFTPTAGSLQDLSASSPWLLVGDEGGDVSCMEECAHDCDYAISELAFRSALFGSVGATSEPAACVANEITVSWDPANGNAASTNTCTYDGDITLPTAPTKTGYIFSGWKLVTPSAQ